MTTRDFPGMARSTAIPDQRCPQCGRAFDTASHAIEAISPKPGDLTVCLGCASVLQFDKAMRNRVVSEAQLRRMRQKEPATMRQVAKIQRAILAMHGDR